MSDAKSQKTKKPINQNLTVPNAMSVFRILVIPFFAYFFLKGNLTAAIVALGLSGLSDALDGMIARHFNQITELGKMLDPLADKLTQGTVAICIAVHYPSIWPLLALLVLKELVMLCGACYLLKNGKKPCAAKWYGKVSTTLFYIAIGLIVVMDGFMKVSESTFNIASTTALVITAGFMVYTFIRYYRLYLFRGCGRCYSIFRRVPRNFEIDRWQIRFEPARRNAGKERAHTEKLTVCAGKENVYDDVYTLQEAACGCVRFPFNGYERHAGLLSCLRKRARH